MPISLKANSDGSAEILNGVISALKVNTDGSLEGTTIDGKLDKSENIVLGTSVAASGTAVDFVGIPEGVKRITVMFDGVSTNGTSRVQIQIGDGAISATGYVGACGGNFSTTGILIDGGSAADARRGVIALSRINNNAWGFDGTTTAAGTTANPTAGFKSLSGPLDRLRITTVNGADTFDAGTINIAWEF